MNKPLSLSIEHRVLKAMHVFGRRLPLLRHGISLPCVLCYHSISDDVRDGSLHPEEFRYQMRMLIRDKRVVPLAELVRHGTTLRNAVAITFDDGYEDVFLHALPIVRSLGLTVTVFVLGSQEVSQHTGLTDGKKLMSLPQLRQLMLEGWEIGFHSTSHRDLTALTNNEVEKEIVQGKRDLERRLGSPLRFFAYPFGRQNAAVAHAVKKAGFQAAFTTSGGPLKLEDHPFRLARVVVGSRTTEDLQLLLTDGGMAVNRMVEHGITIKETLRSVFSNSKASERS